MTPARTRTCPECRTVFRDDGRSECPNCGARLTLSAPEAISAQPEPVFAQEPVAPLPEPVAPLTAVPIDVEEPIAQPIEQAQPIEFDPYAPSATTELDSATLPWSPPVSTEAERVRVDVPVLAGQHLELDPVVEVMRRPDEVIPVPDSSTPAHASEIIPWYRTNFFALVVVLLGLVGVIALALLLFDR